MVQKIKDQAINAASLGQSTFKFYLLRWDIKIDHLRPENFRSPKNMEILKRLDKTKFEESTTHKKTNPTSFLCLRKKLVIFRFFRKNDYTSNHTHVRTPTKNPASTCPFFTCPMGAFSSSTPWVPPQPLSSPARSFNCKTSPF